MRAAAIVLISAAVFIWVAPVLALAAVFLRDRRADRAAARRRTELGREVSPEWLAVLAAVEPTPVYDALVCESIERAEGWVA